MSEQERFLYIAQGQVQGVGFRPFVWKLATEEGLSGHVGNTSAGAAIEAQGEKAALERFEKRLQAELPPLARMTELKKRPLEAVDGETGFEIRASRAHAGQNVLVAPDIGICGECLEDIRNPGNRRHGHAFANCTNCGPRFSITAAIPYDRSSTAMKCFPMCANCEREYGDPANRRFHAQPIACPECGPRIWLAEKGSPTAPSHENASLVIERAARLLLQGKILAIRGLGGFQLACNARNPEAVRELRKRKRRPHKALAVMAASIAAIRSFCDPDDSLEALLASPARPIALCPVAASPQMPLAGEIAPDTATIGAMLPNTPLHALLLDRLERDGMANPVLVMTSANPPGEPICLGNREAVRRLGDLADAWLLHDRDILCRVDDSVVGQIGDAPVFFRRARGYVPSPVKLGLPGPCVLGVGAQLKAAFCLTRGTDAFLSQHIGDMDSPASLEFFEEALRHMLRLLEIEPEAIMHDAHPDFMSTRLALEIAQRHGVPAFPLQHHAAHAAACLAENGCMEMALAICLDGSGLGSDASIWGGEIISMSLGEAVWERVGGLSQFALPGGEKAISEPWRIACGLAADLGIAPLPPTKDAFRITEMLRRNLNCPKTSSCGRLFDAVASLCGVCHAATYEGQAPMKLEKAAASWLAAGTPARLLAEAPIPEKSLLDSRAIFMEAHSRMQSGETAGAVAAWFHERIAHGFAERATALARERGVAKIALTGGVMQNGLLAGMLRKRLLEAGLEPLTHRHSPPGDGGISLGQAAWGMRLLAKV